MSTQFENHARDEFEKHQVPIDVESLWENVYPLVKEEKKDRKFLWFFLSGFAIAGALAFALYFMQIGDSISDAKTTTEQTIQNTTSNTVRNDNETEASESLNLESTNSSNNINTINSTGNPEAPATTFDSQTALEDSSDQNAISTSSSANAVKPSDSAAQPKVSDLNKRNTTPEKKGISLNTESFSNAKPLSDSKQSASELDTDANIKSTSQLTTISNIATTNNKQEQLQLNKLPLSLFANNFLATLALPELTDDIQTDESKKEKEDQVKKIRNKFTRDMRLGVGFYGGYSGTSFDISPNNGDYQQYIQSRKETERQLETIHLGLNVLLKNKYNFYLRSGVEYTRIASLFEFKDADKITVNDSIPGIVEIRINSLTNDTIEIQGFLTETTIESYRKKTYNYFHLIDIPVILGYNFTYDSWQFGLEAGIYANVYLKRKGEIFDLEGDFYDLATDKNNWYKTNVGITPYIGLNAAYSINDNFQIHASPGFRFKKVFTTTKASPAKERRANLGMQMGLRYFF